MLLTLCLTHDCNLRCAYCYAGRKFKHHMNHAIAKRAIDLGLEECLQLSREGAEKRLQLGFFGGEPLLQWELLRDATEYARSQAAESNVELDLAVTTNGSLMTEDRVTWCCQQGMRVLLSLDGHADMHNTLRKFRDGQDSHAHCSRVLKWFRAEKNAVLELVVVVDPRTAKHVSEAVRWLLAEGVRKITLNPNFFAEWDTQSLETWRSEYQKICDLYVAAYRSGEPVEISFIDSKITTGVHNGFPDCSICGFGEDELAIAPSGNIYPCERVVADDTNSDLCIGHVLTGFDKEKRHSIMSGRGNVNEACIGCTYQRRCMNWCCCVNYAITGETNQTGGIVCFHEQMTIDLADRTAETLYAESNPLFLERYYGV